jgi:hypothetical protein
MTTLGSNLDYVKIIKDTNIITIIETYSNQTYSGLGHSNKASLSVNSTASVYNKQNLQISLKNENITIKSNAGSIHNFNYNTLELKGIKASNVLEFAQLLLK